MYIRVCSFFERLTGLFSTGMDSFDSFLQCRADSDRLTFFKFTHFSLCTLRAFKYYSVQI